MQRWNRNTGSHVQEGDARRLCASAHQRDLREGPRASQTCNAQAWKTTRCWTHAPCSEGGLYEFDLKGKGSESENERWDHIRLKSFCTAKPLSRGDRPTERETLFASPSDKGLMSEAYEETGQTDRQKLVGEGWLGRED